MSYLKKIKINYLLTDLFTFENRIFENLPVLDELGSKLSSLMEKNASNTFTNSYDTE